MLKQHLYFLPSLNIFCTVISENKINQLVAVDVVEGNILQGELYLVKESDLVSISPLTNAQFPTEQRLYADYVPANCTMMGFHTLSETTAVVAHHQPTNQLLLIDANVAFENALSSANNQLLANLSDIG